MTRCMTSGWRRVTGVDPGLFEHIVDFGIGESLCFGFGLFLELGIGGLGLFLVGFLGVDLVQQLPERGNIVDGEVDGRLDGGLKLLELVFRLVVVLDNGFFGIV